MIVLGIDAAPAASGLALIDARDRLHPRILRKLTSPPLPPLKSEWKRKRDRVHLDGGAAVRTALITSVVSDHRIAGLPIHAVVECPHLQGYKGRKNPKGIITLAADAGAWDQALGGHPRVTKLWPWRTSTQWRKVLKIGGGVSKAQLILLARDAFKFAGPLEEHEAEAALLALSVVDCRELYP